MRRDYYEVLEIKSGASAVEIRRAYQRLARQYSPDVNLWEREAQALYSEIGEAYRVLSDPIARALYDRQGAPRVERAGPDETTGRERATGRRGDDLHLPVELSFQQAVSGLELELPVHRLSPCVDCGATGTDRTAPPVPCTHCRGVGVLWQGGGESPSPADCPACGGAGRRIAAPCRACRGRGVKPSRDVVAVTLPPGLDTGSQVRVPGEGHSGPFAGPRGDLIVSARVAEDPVFTRKG
ncbi:MAG TPA: J domain-containing protein, partial [Methylomirabilota bacterium]|nr:J domain-containing protein [Methylomirabilota bacterium]